MSSLKNILFLFAGIWILFASTLTARAAGDDLFDAILQGGLSDVGKDAYHYTNPESPKPVGVIVADIIEVALGSLGILFLAFIVYAGFQFMTARGNTEQVGGALSLIRNAIIGLIIVLAAYAITLFIFENITKATFDTQGIEVY